MLHFTDGPFLISCGSEKMRLYWKVNETNKVVATDDVETASIILANRPGICRIVPENEVPSCSPGNNAKCPAILITLGQRSSFVLLSYISI